MATLPVFFSMGGRPVKTRGRASAVLRAIDWPALPMLSKIPRWLRPQLCYHEHPSVCGGGEEPNSLLVRLLPPPLPNLKVNIQGRGARGGPGLAWTVQGGKIAGYTGLG